MRQGGEPAVPTAAIHKSHFIHGACRAVLGQPPRCRYPGAEWRCQRV